MAAQRMAAVLQMTRAASGMRDSHHIKPNVCAACMAAVQCVDHILDVTTATVNGTEPASVTCPMKEGMADLQVMGGRFRSVMPSDLFKPGAMARESLRAPGRDYASSVNREELQRLMRRWAFSLQSHEDQYASCLI